MTRSAGLNIFGATIRFRRADRRAGERAQYSLVATHGLRHYDGRLGDLVGTFLRDSDRLGMRRVGPAGLAPAGAVAAPRPPSSIPLAVAVTPGAASDGDNIARCMRRGVVWPPPPAVCVGMGSGARAAGQAGTARGETRSKTVVAGRGRRASRGDAGCERALLIAESRGRWAGRRPVRRKAGRLRPKSADEFYR